MVKTEFYQLVLVAMNLVFQMGADTSLLLFGDELGLFFLHTSKIGYGYDQGLLN